MQKRMQKRAKLIQPF